MTDYPYQNNPVGSATLNTPEASRSSNPRAETRQRMLADEELSEYEFDARSHRIALEAHEDRLKLWEDVERLELRCAALLEAECDKCPVVVERDRLRAALAGLKDLTCGECVPCNRINAEIDKALSGEPTSAHETSADCSTGVGGVTLAQMAENIKHGADPYAGAETSVSLSELQQALTAEGEKDYRIEALEAALDWAIHAVFTHYTEGEVPAVPGAFEEIEKSRARYIAEAKRLAALPRRVAPPKFCAVDECMNRVAPDQEVCHQCAQKASGELEQLRRIDRAARRFVEFLDTCAPQGGVWTDHVPTDLLDALQPLELALFDGRASENGRGDV